MLTRQTLLCAARTTFLAALVSAGSACVTEEMDVAVGGDAESEVRLVPHCSVLPDRPAVSASYQVLAEGLPRKRAVQLIIADAGRSVSVDLVTSSAGEVTASAAAATPGPGVVSVYLIGASARKLVATCGFEVVAASSCGDGRCDAGEACGSCASDCGACLPTCGDGSCDVGETCTTCVSDCGACARDCSALGARPDWSLCSQDEQSCRAVFLDGTGCVALCAAAGLDCVAVFENLDGQCAANTALPALSCTTSTGHQSDYCVCGESVGCVPNCGGQRCGDDGCGGSCGLCGPDEECVAGACQGSVGEGPVAGNGLRTRQDLVNGIFGYAAEGGGTTGGLGGTTFHVTNANDAGPGSLRDALSQGQRWIVFDGDYAIRLTSPLRAPSNFTVDGSGRDVTLYNYGIYVEDQHNFIIYNLKIFDGAATDVERDGDAIRVMRSERGYIRNVWVRGAADGGCDVTQTSRYVTVSHANFSGNNKSMLLGNFNAQDAAIRVTVYRSYFHDGFERNPWMIFGKLDMIESYVTGWSSGQGTAGSCNAELTLRRCMWDSSAADSNALVTDMACTGYTTVPAARVRLLDSQLLNGANAVRANLDDTVALPTYSTPPAVAAGTALRDLIIAEAGWQLVPQLLP